MSQYRAYFVPGAVDPIGEYLVARTNDDYPWVSAEPGSKFCCTYKESWGKIWSWTLDGISLGETPMERCKRRMQGVWGGWTTSWRVVSAKKGECPRRLKEPDIFTQGYERFCGPTRAANLCDCTNGKPSAGAPLWMRST